MDSSTDAGKEDDDESSSSSSSCSVSESTPKRTELDEFREKWQQELKKEQQQPKPVAKSSKPSAGTGRNAVVGSGNNKENVSVEQQARTLFLQGTELERGGKVFEAMRLYRRATQLVPDIEFKVFEKKPKQPIAADATDGADSSTMDGLAERMVEANIDEEEEDLENVDLVLRFQTLMGRSGKLFDRAASDRMLIVTAAHLSDLPMELMLYILRWVVSNELDMKSLERFASVCRGFFLLARDPEIWRHACMRCVFELGLFKPNVANLNRSLYLRRVWGVNMGVLKGSPFSSWREMYINRPRVHFHGCYISRASYLRSGENSFQDQFYRPIQLVEYYRYVRFFADGQVLMLTTADEPQQCVAKLKQRWPAQNEILRGHYR